MTYASSSRSVEGFSVSKSISISSGLESFSAGSRACMISTIRPSLSPAYNTSQTCQYHIIKTYYQTANYVTNRQISSAK